MHKCSECLWGICTFISMNYIDLFARASGLSEGFQEPKIQS